MVMKPEAEESNLSRCSGGPRGSSETHKPGHVRAVQSASADFSTEPLQALMKMVYLLSALAVAMLATSVQGRSYSDDSEACRINTTAHCKHWDGLQATFRLRCSERTEPVPGLSSKFGLGCSMRGWRLHEYRHAASNGSR